MKIRIRDNSIRFRLTQSEVRELAEQGAVLSSTSFSNRPFIYAVEASSVQALSASFVDNKILLQMPIPMVREWVETDRVGFEGQADQVKLLIEKDFVCIDNSTEDQSDNYPNPNIKC